MGSAERNHLPTLREELDRKVFETVQWLIVGLEKGRLSTEQFSMGMNTAFMTVSGIADSDFINIITESQAQCEGVRPTIEHTFHSPTEAHIRGAIWIVGDDKVTMTVRRMGVVVTTGVQDFEDAKTARLFVERFESAMGKTDWIKL